MRTKLLINIFLFIFLTTPNLRANQIPQNCLSLLLELTPQGRVQINPLIQLKDLLTRSGHNSIMLETLEQTDAGKALLKEILGEQKLANFTKRGQATNALVEKLTKDNQRDKAETLIHNLKNIYERWIKVMSNDLNKEYDKELNQLAQNFLKIDQKVAELGAAEIDNTNLLKQKLSEITTLDSKKWLKTIFEKYEALLNTEPDFDKIVDQKIILEQLNNLDLQTYSKRLELFIEAYKNQNEANTPKQKASIALKKILDGVVPQTSIQSRIDYFLNNPLDKLAFERAMGDMTLEEVKILLHGPDYLNPSADSLIGKYISETNAVTKKMRFKIPVPSAEGEQGPERLVVALSPQSYESFKKLLVREEFFSVFGHAHVLHNGLVSSYHRHGSEFVLGETLYTPYPWVALKPTEGQRMTRYLRFMDRRMAKQSWNGAEMQPWILNGPHGSYCPSSRFGGCTAWIGNAPIGDSRTMIYKIDAGAEALQGSKNDGILRPFNVPDRNIDLDNQAEIQDIWKVPGHLQLSEVLDQVPANRRGEFANPGWLIHTLMSRVDTQRVPVVFIRVQDHTAPFPDEMALNIEAPR